MIKAVNGRQTLTVPENLDAYFVAPVEVSGGMVEAVKLWQRFDDSTYGIHMSEEQPLRFGPHYYPGIAEDIGGDAYPDLHQILTGIHVARILDAEWSKTGQLPIPKPEVGLLVVSGLLHDIGECTHPNLEQEVGVVIGDVPYGEKSENMKIVESMLREELWRRLYSDVPKVIWARIEAIIAHKDETVLHDIFQAAHDIQTLDTAFKAQAALDRRYAALNPEGTDIGQEKVDEPIVKLEILIDEVTGRMNPFVLEWAKKFTYAKSFVDRYAVGST